MEKENVRCKYCGKKLHKEYVMTTSVCLYEWYIPEKTLPVFCNDDHMNKWVLNQPKLSGHLSEE